MNLRLRLLALYTPGWLQRYMLRELFQRTAAAFGCPVPPPAGRAPATLLDQYARFTCSMAEAALNEGRSALPDMEAVMPNLRCHCESRTLFSGRHLRLHAVPMSNFQAAEEIASSQKNAPTNELGCVVHYSLNSATAPSRGWAATREGGLWITRNDRFGIAALEDRLYREAYVLGVRLRRLCGVTTRQDVMDAAQWLYRVLGIAFHGTAAGEIEIRRCTFSDVYSGPVCRLISALDQGVLAGLAGGGQLTFQARLTEGAAACRACFDWEGERA